MTWSARQLIEGLYGAEGVLLLPWIRTELPALVSMNTRKASFHTGSPGSPPLTVRQPRVSRKPPANTNLGATWTSPEMRPTHCYLAGCRPRVKRRMIQNAKSLYTWSSGQLPPRPHPSLKDRPAFKVKEGLGLRSYFMNRATNLVKRLTEALPPEFAMPEHLSPEGQRAWKIITDFLQKRRLTRSGGHSKVFYSPEEWKRHGEDETNGELFIVHDGGEHARAISWEAEDEKTREALQVALKAVGMFMEQITYTTSGVYKIMPLTNLKPREPEPTARPEEPNMSQENLIAAAHEFLGEEFPPVGASRRAKSKRDRLDALRKRRGEDEDGKVKEGLTEGDAQPGYDVPRDEHPEDFQHGHLEAPGHEEEEQDEITLAKSILKHVELVKAALPQGQEIPGVIQNLEVIQQQAEQLLTMHGADTEVALESMMSRLLDGEDDEGDDDNTPIEAHGVRGMNSTPWRKKFKNRKALNAWVEKGDGDIEVRATRKAD